MPDDDGNQGQGEEQEVRLKPEDLRALRAAVKERDELQQKLQEQNRDLAFMKANLDINDPKVKYFIKGYDGELTPEAIRAQAEADGFIAKVQDSQPDLDAQQRIMRASAGANATGDVDLGDLIAQANSPEEVMKVMMAAGRPTSWNRPTDR